MRKNLVYIISVVIIAVGLVIGGAWVVKAVNDSINVNEGGVLNIYNQAREGDEFGFTSASGFTTTGDISAANITATGNFSVVDVTASGDLSAGDDLTVTDDANITDELQYGGVEHDWIEGTCTDATTTPVGVVNPFGVNVIVDEFYIRIVNGTSTLRYTCGTSSVGVGLSADPTDLLLDDVEIATTTDGTATNTEAKIVINRIGSGSRSNVSGITDPGTNSEDRIVWESGDYIACYADYTGVSSNANGLTNAANWADCSYKIHTYR